MEKNYSHKKISKYKNGAGFTMLIAIITTSMLLLVSFVIVNIAYKQILLAASSRESQYAYYNAETGVECAMYWDFKNGPVSAFDLSQSWDVASCSGNPVFHSGGVATSTFTLSLPKGCVNVSVGKTPSGTTYIDSRGYNNCVSGVARRVERGIKVAY